MLFEKLRNLFKKKITLEEAEELYYSILYSFDSYINDSEAPKEIKEKFWNTITKDELDLIKYEYVRGSLIRSLPDDKINSWQFYVDYFPRFLESRKLKNYLFMVRNLHFPFIVTKVLDCKSERRVLNILENLEKFRKTVEKYNKDAQYYHEIKDSVKSGYDKRVIDYVYWTGII